MKNLTGRVRYRAHQRLFRKPLLVLQVEERKQGVSYNSNDPFDTGKEYANTYWRDATLEDQTQEDTLAKADRQQAEGGEP